jgi:hypothetical protein
LNKLLRQCRCVGLRCVSSHHGEFLV